MIINRYSGNNYAGILGVYRRIKDALKDRFPGFYERFVLPISYSNQSRKVGAETIRQIREMYLNGETRLFTKIELETSNRCNGTCSFCPVNRNLDPRTFEQMDEKLFDSILMQLHSLDYSGMLGLYSNNEPLLDKRFLIFCKKARAALPKSHLYIHTNGTLLTVDILVEAMRSLDKIYINNYNDRLELNESVRKVSDYCSQNPLFADKVVINLRKNTEMLSNRGGQAKNRTLRTRIESPCLLPFCQLVIRPSGKVSLCSFDALGETTMGDLTKNTIVEVWNSEVYKDYRAKMLTNRGAIHICGKCDIIMAA